MKEFYSTYTHAGNIGEELTLLFKEGYEVFQMFLGENDKIWIIYFKNIK